MKKPKELCALCGKNIATTRDHIPPKGIYPKEMRNKIELLLCLKTRG
jgi:hypothetical protein